MQSMRMPARRNVGSVARPEPSLFFCSEPAGKPFDPEGVTEAVEYVRSLIAEEVAAGIPLDRMCVPCRLRAAVPPLHLIVMPSWYCALLVWLSR